MTPEQQARRARNRAAKETALAREAEHQEKRAIAAWLRTAPECDTWYDEATDSSWNELAPTAHQILRASIVPDERILDYMAANVSNLGFFNWRNGGRQDIRRAFPDGTTAEQIVIKLWSMEARELIRANLDAGRFGLCEGGVR